MKTNLESKNILAKLLATEDLQIEHQNVSTASFDVKDRVLTLPKWEKMSNDMYDGLIGHEVGHALFTPFEKWKVIAQDKGYLKPYVNITEDARIERDMKTKYPGLKRVMYNMYSEMLERDFFGLKDQDVNDLGFADRVNIHFKAGVRAGVNFNETEQPIVDALVVADSFEEIVKIAEDIYAVAKAQNDGEIDGDDELDFNIAEDGEEFDFDFDDAQDGINLDSEESQETKDGPTTDGDAEEGEDKEGDGKNSGAGGEPDAPFTNNRMDEAAESYASTDTRTNVYVEMPKIDLKNIVTNYKEVHESIDKFYSDAVTTGRYDAEREKGGQVAEYLAFKKASNKEVNYLVKEFEMRKAADAYKRTSTAKTGVLNTNKMHAYKYTDDIFKRMATVQDGKNHGLVMYVDWSGSMAGNVLGTMKQTMTLVQFCRKVNIPFRVYSFNNINTNTQVPKANGEAYEYDRIPFAKMEAKDLQMGKKYYMPSSLNLRELFSNEMTTKQLENASKQMYRVANSIDDYWVMTPDTMQMGSTPLVETIIASTEQVASFKNNYGLDIVNTVFLTDGDTDGNEYYKYLDSEGETCSRYLNSNEVMVVRDPITGKEYSCETDWGTSSRQAQTTAMLEMLKDRTGSNVVGFFVGQARNIKRYARTDLQKKTLRQEKYFDANRGGYDKFFIVATDNMNDEVEDMKEVDRKDGKLQKGKLKSAFKKFNNTKRSSKVMLKEFVELVA